MRGRSPLDILSAQAGLLARLTNGTLLGTVETGRAREAVLHRLVVIAPFMAGHRHTLILARHEAHRPYPVEIRAGAEDAKTREYPVADSEAEMSELLRTALQSDETRTVIQALLAQHSPAAE
jgi:hypothetical protein